MKLLKEVKLTANSVRGAWYLLRLCQLPHDLGYIVVKKSGCNGKVAHEEQYFRSKLEDAEAKFKRIEALKTKEKEVGRVYQHIPVMTSPLAYPDDAQLFLF